MRSRLRPVAVALGLFVVHPLPAQAELASDAAQLLARWRADGGRASAIGTAFLPAGGSRRFEVPPLTSSERPCLTVVALAVRGAAFHLERVRPIGEEASGADDDEPTTEGDDRGESGDEVPPRVRANPAGFAVLSSCSKASAHSAARRPGDVVVSFGSSRGAVEVVAVAHAGPVVAVESILLDRGSGPTLPTVEGAPPLPLAPLDERVARTTQLVRIGGAVDVVTAESASDDRGAGAVMMRLSRGCHRLGVLADVEPMQGTDVDAELRIEDTTEPFRFDRSHAPEARLELCLAEPSRVELRWGGGPPEGRVVLLDARWELPSLPAKWGVESRTAVAWALWRRRAPFPREAPVAHWLGVGGSTAVPLTLEPGACYLAAVGTRSGEPSALRLRVLLGLDAYQDEAGEPPYGAAVTWCTGASTRARALVDVRGSNISYRLVLWRLLGATR